MSHNIPKPTIGTAAVMACLRSCSDVGTAPLLLLLAPEAGADAAVVHDRAPRFSDVVATRASPRENIVGSS